MAAAAESRIKLPNTPGRSISLNPVANGSTSASDPARHKYTHTAEKKLSALTLAVDTPERTPHKPHLFGAIVCARCCKPPHAVKGCPANKIPLRTTGPDRRWSVVRELADEIVGPVLVRDCKTTNRDGSSPNGRSCNRALLQRGSRTLIICNLLRFATHTAFETAGEYSRRRSDYRPDRHRPKKNSVSPTKLAEVWSVEKFTAITFDSPLLNDCSDRQ